MRTASKDGAQLLKVGVGWVQGTHQHRLGDAMSVCMYVCQMCAHLSMFVFLRALGAAHSSVHPPRLLAQKMMLAFILLCSMLTATATFLPTENTPPPRCMQVLENRELQGSGAERSTRHVQLQLPEGPGGSYSSGEHLEVYGNNDASLVETALKLLGLGGAAGVA